MLLLLESADHRMLINTTDNTDHEARDMVRQIDMISSTVCSVLRYFVYKPVT